MTRVEELIEKISEKDPLQKKHLRECAEYLQENELADFEKQLEYLCEKYSLEQCGEGYVTFVNSSREEKKYFFETGHYRYSTFAETDKYVYHNPEYMKLHMIGLQISGYLFSQHLDIHRWFKQKIKEFDGGGYLEIGPGHGQYFCEAVNERKFKKYTAIDVSPTSLENAKEYVERNLGNKDSVCDFICDDFCKHTFAEKFDCVCMGEVLEHVENPKTMLKKIFDVASENANIYITVPANAPEVDHIYLFHSAEEIYDMVQDAGFKIVDKCLAMEKKGITYEKALKKKYAVLVALHLKK